MITSLTVDFGKIDIFDQYVIAIMNEGVIIRPEFNVILVDIAEKYFKDKKFGYISFRKNSYSVDPKIYLKTSEIVNLVGFAIISDTKIQKQNLAIEKIFLKKPMKIFTKISAAQKWIISLI